MEVCEYATVDDCPRSSRGWAKVLVAWWEAGMGCNSSLQEISESYLLIAVMGGGRVYCGVRPQEGVCLSAVLVRDDGRLQLANSTRL